MLDSYHLYGNLNQAAQNENAYFNDSVTSLQMKDRNLSDTSKIIYIKQIEFTAFMNLLIALSLIIATTVTLIVILDGYVILRKYIITIGTILAIIALIIYILTISSHVHTAPNNNTGV
jgi:hypothetical protein